MEWNYNSVLINTGLLHFVEALHSGTGEQYIDPPQLTALGLVFPVCTYHWVLWQQDLPEDILILLDLVIYLFCKPMFIYIKMGMIHVYHYVYINISKTKPKSILSLNSVLKFKIVCFVFWVHKYYICHSYVCLSLSKTRKHDTCIVLCVYITVCYHSLHEITLALVALLWHQHDVL